MLRIRVTDSIADPGRADRENEDRVGWNDGAVFVVDGATSLGAPLVEPPRSDAAWLAELAAGSLRGGLAEGVSTADAVRAAIRLAQDRFAAATDGAEVEPWRRPTAGFQTVRVDASGVETAGLGDCVLFLRDAAGRSLRWSALALKRSREKFFAKKALDESGGFDRAGVAYHKSDVLAGLRSGRAKHNTPGGTVWTLGLEPLAADHIRIERLDVAAPATGVLCTDGFGDIVDAYGLYDLHGLLDRAEAGGLAGLVSELRRLEREVDPEGAIYPRFKQSDDASALLFRIEA